METPSSVPVQGVSVICVPEVLAVGGCKAAAWVLAAFEHPVHWALLASSMGSKKQKNGCKGENPICKSSLKRALPLLILGWLWEEGARGPGYPQPRCKSISSSGACAAQVAAGEEKGLYQHLLGMTHTSLWLLYPSRSYADKSSTLNHPVLCRTRQPGHTSVPLPTPPYLTTSISVLIPHPAPRQPRLPKPWRVCKPP